MKKISSRKIKAWLLHFMAKLCVLYIMNVCLDSGCSLPFAIALKCIWHLTMWFTVLKAAQSFIEYSLYSSVLDSRDRKVT